ncbi:MAG: hypothetical protein E6J08_09725 [Chloroflexi bacterium]|nr:MAG: hypothetical protein E6J08_09725 [Chloroflexota bacterium]
MVAHMTTARDLMAVMKTAHVHCRPGGAALFVPDEMRETFVPSTDHGGYDTEKRSLRYVQWVTDPDPKDTTVQVDFGFLLKDSRGRVRMVHERQNHGLFARAEWMRMLRRAGFTPSIVSDKTIRDVFLGRRRLDSAPLTPGVRNPGRRSARLTPDMRKRARRRSAADLRE